MSDDTAKELQKWQPLIAFCYFAAMQRVIKRRVATEVGMQLFDENLIPTAHSYWLLFQPPSYFINKLNGWEPNLTHVGMLVRESCGLDVAPTLRDRVADDMDYDQPFWLCVSRAAVGVYFMWRAVTEDPIMSTLDVDSKLLAIKKIRSDLILHCRYTYN